ncbi:MAG TPA: hypothetical protein VF465_06560 [Flavobacterium sp.]|jgi:hypothetical protein|uniref:hypothetical protein n=1 Tax=Flavobacterium sp. TaxID=239 RepID=UPI002ED5F4E1
MKTKQVIILSSTGNAQSVFVGAVPGTNKISGENGFIALGFSAKEGTPTDPKKGKKLADILFPTEDEALKQGEKIIKAQIKAEIALHKKRIAAAKKGRK